MGVPERRQLILKTLCRRRYEIIENLAEEFGVSQRTIKRDIDILSTTEPIYTVKGRYGGGVYVVDGYYSSINYFTSDQSTVISKVINFAERTGSGVFNENEILILRDILRNFEKPCV